MKHQHHSTEAAIEAVERGYQPVPVRAGGKNPHISAWTHVAWDADDLSVVRQKFDEWADEGATNIGLLLGAPSNGLIDIDLDHPRAMRLRDYFLPPTPMRTGRAGRPMSHYWYRVDEIDDLPDHYYHRPDKVIDPVERIEHADRFFGSRPSMWCNFPDGLRS